MLGSDREEPSCRLRCLLRTGPRRRYRLDEEGNGRADSLSELVSLEDEDSESIGLFDERKKSV